MVTAPKKRSLAARLPDTRRARQGVAELMNTISYEVMPFASTGDAVLEHVPTDVPITITVTEAKGIGATLALSARLSSAGYSVNPHLPARQIADRAELDDIVAQMIDARIDKAFVVGGDAAEPKGEFSDAADLLRALEDMGSPLSDTGISGYPEGHAQISDEALEAALEAKAPYASRIVTQMCFDAHTIVDWAGSIAARGVATPVIVGIPGPVSRQKLVRISAGIGLGQSARFLQKQHGLIRTFLTPGGVNPDRLVRELGSEVPRASTNIAGIRIFTFNEIAKTEQWRQQTIAALDKR